MFILHLRMATRKWILFFAGIAFIVGFFLIPANRHWCSKVLSYWRDLPAEIRHTSPEARLTKRFENDYTFSRYIAAKFDGRSDRQEVLVLMPPTSYFSKMGFRYHVPEPAVFYYYTGLKTIWANSPQAVDADWYVRVSEGKMAIDSVTDRKSLQDTITAWKKLGVAL